MKRSLCIYVGVGLLAACSVQAKQVQVTLLIDALDGCGCLPPFDDPISCPTCPNGVFSGFPNSDVFGPNSVEVDWHAAGYAADFAGDNNVVTQGFASQKFTIGTQAASRVAFGADFVMLAVENPTDQCCNPFRLGRYNFETARVAQGLPSPNANSPVTLTYSRRRSGAGGGSCTVETHAKIFFSGLTPNTITPTETPKAQRVLPNDQQWHDETLLTLSSFPQSMFLGLAIELGPTGCSAITALDVNIDKVVLIYTATVPDNETACDNGIDDDVDGLKDCADPDCAATQACTGWARAHDPVFDVDEDGDVDHDDFGVFQRCITGSGDPSGVFNSLSDDCKCMDKLGPGGVPDKAVDQQDYSRFENCSTGPDPATPASPSCDD